MVFYSITLYFCLRLSPKGILTICVSVGDVYPPTDIPADIESIPLEKFQEHVKSLHEDDQYDAKEEYKVCVCVCVCVCACVCVCVCVCVCA